MQWNVRLNGREAQNPVVRTLAIVAASVVALALLALVVALLLIFGIGIAIAALVAAPILYLYGRRMLRRMSSSGREVEDASYRVVESRPYSSGDSTEHQLASLPPASSSTGIEVSDPLSNIVEHRSDVTRSEEENKEHDSD